MEFLWLSVIIIALLVHPSYSTVGTYAALGDSYAAGDGAGSSRWFPHLDPACGRFSEAYPVQIAQNSSLGVDHFRNVACGGATTKSIVYRQMLYLRGADLVTIQVGGNEVDFFPVLNECIQQWRPLSTCDREINRARSLIQSSRFVQAFDDMVKHATSKTNIGKRLLILGYATFFNAGTEQCNKVSFSKTNPANVLSNELRASFNDLVVMLNTVIESSARAHGATYLDIDTLFEGHRFCEEGVDEPRPDWEGTWFFREAPSPAVKQTPRLSDLPTDSQSQTGLLTPFGKFSDLTRTFHPTGRGHRAIAEHISDIVTELSFVISQATE